MSAPSQPRPTESELSILRILWARSPLSVREVLHILQQDKPTGYTTVLKLLQIMTEKGLVERDDSCRPQLYRASSSEQQTQKQLLKHLVDRAFGGSTRALVLQALASKRSSKKELDEIDKLLDRLEGERK